MITTPPLVKKLVKKDVSLNSLNDFYEDENTKIEENLSSKELKNVDNGFFYPIESFKKYVKKFIF